MTTKWGSMCKLYFRKRSRNSQGKYISKQQQQRQGKRVIQINRRWSGQEANDQNKEIVQDQNMEIRKDKITGG